MDGLPRVVMSATGPSQTGRWACFFEVDSTVEEPSRTQDLGEAGLAGSPENLLEMRDTISLRTRRISFHIL